MARNSLKRIATSFLSCLLIVSLTAQQAVGIVSTVANLVAIVEGQNATPIQSQQPIVEGATYQASASSAAEFTFPEGLRAAAGPSSSVAFHPSPAAAGTRLVSVSEGLYRFSFPAAGSRLDIQTPYGAIQTVGGAPGSELVTRVGADGTVQVTVTRGSVELRDWRGGALILLNEGQSATLGAAAGGTLAVTSTGGAVLGTEIAALNAILSGQGPATATASAGVGAAAGDGAAADTSGGITRTQGLIGVGLFAAAVGGIIAATSGGGGGDGSTTTTTTTTTSGPAVQ